MASLSSPNPPVDDRAQRLLFTSFLVLVALAPLPLGGFRPLPWNLNAVAVGLLLLAWGGLLIRDGNRPAVGLRRLAVPMALVLAVAAWIAFQALAGVSTEWAAPVWAEAWPLPEEPPAQFPISVHPEAGMVVLLRFLTHAGVFFLAVQMGRSRQQAERIFTVLAYMGMAYALYGLIMHLGGFNRVLWWERWAYTDSVTSTFVNRNHYATFAGLTLLCAMGMIGRFLLHHGRPGGVREWLELLAETLERHWPLLLTVWVGFAALALSRSRAGLFVGLAGMVMLVVVLTRSRRVAWRSARLLVTSMAVLTAILVFTLGGGTLSRFDDWNFHNDSRAELFRLTVRAIADSPWMGFGAGSFGDVFRIYQNTRLSDAVFWDYAHNSYLEFALELGVPALLALLAAGAWVVGRCVVGVMQRRRDRTYAAVGIAASLLVGLHATVDFSLQLPGVAIPYLALLGVAYAQSWPSERRRVRRHGG